MKKLLVLLLLTPFILFASEGKDGGNGGGAFVCRDRLQNAIKVYSYDIWSGEKDGVMLSDNKIKRLTINADGRDAYEQALEAIARIKAINPESKTYGYIYSLAKKILDSTYARVLSEMTLEPQQLTVKGDFVPLRKPMINTFCPFSDGVTLEFETIIIYDDYLKTRLGKFGDVPKYYLDIVTKKYADLLSDTNCSYHVDQCFEKLFLLFLQNREGKKDFIHYFPGFIENSLEFDYLYLDIQLYQAMENNTHRAALLLHEVFYKILRNLRDDITSKNATEVVSLLLSTETNAVIGNKLKALDFHYLKSGDN